MSQSCRQSRQNVLVFGLASPQRAQPLPAAHSKHGKTNHQFRRKDDPERRGWRRPERARGTHVVRRPSAARGGPASGPKPDPQGEPVPGGPVQGTPPWGDVGGPAHLSERARSIPGTDQWQACHTPVPRPRGITGKPEAVSTGPGSPGTSRGNALSQGISGNFSTERTSGPRVRGSVSRAVGQVLREASTGNKTLHFE